MHRPSQRCADLIETTANALSGGAVALILLAIQKNNLELNINRAIELYVYVYSGSKNETSIVLPQGPLCVPSRE
jgi:hypothetical protein